MAGEAYENAMTGERVVLRVGPDTRSAIYPRRYIADGMKSDRA